MSIAEFIANEVKSNDVVLFMKGTPQFPQCGFSGRCDIVREMFQAGELQQLFSEKGVAVAA